MYSTSYKVYSVDDRVIVLSCFDDDLKEMPRKLPCRKSDDDLNEFSFGGFTFPLSVSGARNARGGLATDAPERPADSIDELLSDPEPPSDATSPASRC